MKKQNPGRSKVVLGLTGSFGSGKTTVARIFASLGAKVIDADRIAHNVIKPGTRIYKKIIVLFGKAILKKNKAIDRSKLARIVFDNKFLLKKLNKIVHPEIIRIIKKEIRLSSKKIVVLDAPLLIEAGLLDLTDKLIVVDIKRRIQIQRLLDRGLLSKAEILKRIKAQMPLTKKLELADFIIDNNGTIQETEKQVKRIWRLMWKD